MNMPLRAWPGPLAAPAWLHAHLGSPGLVILDVRSGEDVFAAGHVPGAVHSDYARAGWRATADGAPGMLPPAEDLARLIGGAGIGNDTLVVLVSSSRTASDFGNAARVYWTFKVLGHDRVSILDGGYEAWAADPARPIEKGQPRQPEPSRFEPHPRPQLRATAEEVAAAIARRDTVLADARSAPQFRGEAKSPAARVPGTLPGARHLDVEEIYAQGDLHVPPGAVPEAPGGVITFCNTGHLASLTWFALSEVSGRPNVKLYDGSMSHWTQDPDRPVKKGD